jgi:hypothetical protein
MYFCPKCSYSFDISKATTLSKDKDNRKIISKLPELFKLIDSNADMALYRADFHKEELTGNKRYMKLTDNMKDTLNQLFEKHVISGAEFKCNNCNNTEPIKDTILLYKITIDNIPQKITTIEENKFISNDPLLPRTRDYTCRNPSCITHKNNKIKEAVFYRNNNNTFSLYHICTICHIGW